TSLNGNMFSFLDATGVLALRLPAEERDRFVSDHNTVLFVAHGIALKEYVTVPDHLLKDIRAMKRYFAMSLAYARTLKPKATKRPRKK
ncbi:MAG: hypothetical protein ABI432_06535, partial [Flavobacteriales bacterium]